MSVVVMSMPFLKNQIISPKLIEIDAADKPWKRTRQTQFRIDNIIHWKNISNQTSTSLD